MDGWLDRRMDGIFEYPGSGKCHALGFSCMITNVVNVIPLNQLTKPTVFTQCIYTTYSITLTY